MAQDSDNICLAPGESVQSRHSFSIDSQESQSSTQSQRSISSVVIELSQEQREAEMHMKELIDFTKITELAENRSAEELVKTGTERALKKLSEALLPNKSPNKSETSSQ